MKLVVHGIGVDRAINAIGIDAVQPQSGPAAKTVAAFDTRQPGWIKVEMEPAGVLA